MTEQLTETYTTRRPLDHPIDHDWLEFLVQGVSRKGKLLVPGLRDTHVELRLTTGETMQGLCRGFLPINHDPEYRSPYFTVEDMPLPDVVRQRHISPRAIYSIKPSQ